MGMTIDEALEIIKRDDNDMRKGYFCINDFKAIETLVDCGKKYQKIEDIYYHQTGQALENSLRAVIEDGKIDFINTYTDEGVTTMADDVLDKIRVEIEQLRLHKAQFITNDNKVCIDSQEVLDILDKYKTESEG